MNYLSDSIELARLQAAEEDFNSYCGGSSPDSYEEEQTPEEEAQGLVFGCQPFENMPSYQENLKTVAVR